MYKIEDSLLQPIKKVYVYFDTPALEDVLNNVRHKLELSKDEDFSFVCVSLLIYSKEKIVNGTVAFYNNLIAGGIHKNKQVMWMKFVKAEIEKKDIIKHSSEQFSTTVYKRMDPFYKEKNDAYNEMKEGKTVVDPIIKDKIGKYVVVDSNCPYLPHPKNELWMYNKFPLYGDPNMDPKFKERIKSEYDRNKENYAEKVDQLDLEGKLIKVFNSMYEASKDCGISCIKIFECCIGKIDRTENFKWKFKGI